MRKTSTLVALTLLLFIGMLAPDPTSAQTDPDLSQSYTSQEGISVRFPADWVHNELDSNIILTNSSRLINGSRPARAGELIMSVWSPAFLKARRIESNIGVENLACQIILRRDCAIFTDQTATSRVHTESLTIKGRPAVGMYAVNRNSSASEDRQKARQYFTIFQVDGQTSIVIESLMMPNELDIMLPTILGIAATVEYAAPANSDENPLVSVPSTTNVAACVPTQFANEGNALVAPSSINVITQRMADSASIPVITSENAAQLVLQSSSKPSYQLGEVVLSPDLSMGAVLDLSDRQRRTVNIIDLRTGATLHTFQTENGIKSSSFAQLATFSLDSRRFAVGEGGGSKADSGKVYVWDIEANKLLAMILGQPNARGNIPEAAKIFYSSNGNYLSFLDQDDGSGSDGTSTVPIADIQAGQTLAILTVTGTPDRIEISDDGATVVMLIQRNRQEAVVQAWDTSRNAMTMEVAVNPDLASSDIRLAASGKRVVVIESSQVTVYDLAHNGQWNAHPISQSGTLVYRNQQYNLNPSDPTSPIAMNAGGTLLATKAGVNGKAALVIWDLEAYTVKYTLESEVERLLFLNDTMLLANERNKQTGGQSLVFWDVATGNRIATLDNNIVSFFRFGISAQGKMLAAYAYTTERHEWVAANMSRELVTLSTPIDNTNYTNVGAVMTLPAPADSINDKIVDIAISPDQQHLAVVNENGKLRIWDITTGEIKAEFEDNALSLAFSADAKLLITATRQRVTIWSLETLDKVDDFVLPLPPDNRALSGIPALSADGKLLAGWVRDASRVYRTWLFDITQKTACGVVANAGSSNSMTAEFSSVDYSLFSGTPAGITLWDVTTGVPTELGTLGFNNGVKVSEDGEFVLILSMGQFRLIRRDGSEFGKLNVLGSSPSIAGISLNPTSTILTVAGGTTILLLPVEARQTTQPQRIDAAHTAPIVTSTFAQSGLFFATGDQAGNVKLWAVNQ